MIINEKRGIKCKINEKIKTENSSIDSSKQTLKRRKDDIHKLLYLSGNLWWYHCMLFRTTEVKIRRVSWKLKKKHEYQINHHKIKVKIFLNL